MSALTFAQKHLPIAPSLENLDYAPWIKSSVQYSVCDIPETLPVMRKGFFGPYSENWPISREGCFQEFNAKFTALSTTYAQLKNFLLTLLWCNTEYRNFLQPQEVYDDLFGKMMKGISPPTTLHDLPLAEIATLPVPQIRGHLNGMLAAQAKDLFCWGFSALEQLRRNEYVGGIQWLSNDVCRFGFFKWILEDKAVARRSGVSGVETDWQRSLLHQVHVHQVTKAQKLPWNANIQMPTQVAEMLKRAPAALRPNIEIVDGMEIYRAVLERKVHSEIRTEIEPYPVQMTPMYHHDPCIILGDYVLAGW